MNVDILIMYPMTLQDMYQHYQLIIIVVNAIHLLLTRLFLDAGCHIRLRRDGRRNPSGVPRESRRIDAELAQ